MTKEENNISKTGLSIIPRYAICPIALALVFNCVGFFGIYRLPEIFGVHDLSIALDHRLPLVPGFVFIYFGHFLQWGLSFLLCARESKAFCYRYFSAELFAKTICFLFFIFYASGIARPEVIGDGISEQLLRLLYAHDEPRNLFPSIHCMISWFAVRCAFAQKKTGRLYKWATLVFTLLVFASVLLIKQHVIVDVFGGIAVLELGLLITRRYDLSGLYNAVERKLPGEKIERE